MTSTSLNETLGAELFFKCENFQRTGSFKLRGAMNTTLQLSNDVRTVVTHSSGNHGAAFGSGRDGVREKGHGRCTERREAGEAISD
ncbi:MAG: hypothetical protein Ct9H300mP8_02740 [Gammaproteobacteria bacterium]|nr:MAG: hypothetical protein Ct9H300mP8_02740 [Gammaproteobacteria bacterium]